MSNCVVQTCRLKKNVSLEDICDQIKFIDDTWECPGSRFDCGEVFFDGCVYVLCVLF